MRPSLESLSLIAILRGVRPDEVAAVGGALAQAGIRGIEVPMNSPDALRSIERLRDACGATCLCGAGTVLTREQVEDVHRAGASLVVSPNTDPRVIGRALELGLEVLPGFATPTEAFTALAAGARHLKLFPASTYGTAHYRALRAVLPPEARIYAVGGIGLRTLAEWVRAGIDGLAIGTDLFEPGRQSAEIGERAASIVAAYQVSRGSSRDA
jgi:2-dehydro-3-deoxyphosphogalactonate aldolase